MNEAIKAAKAALEAAKSSYLDELRQDSERSEGSGAQERRREENQKRMLEEIAQCERDLVAAEQADIQKMRAAFEEKYQRDWNDPAGDEMKSVWSEAWAAAQHD